MFYRPEEGHGLAHNPLTAIISPRPIGWISTTGSMGDNLAPYSFFNAVAYRPPQVMFASTGIKDSVKNIRETRVFAVNIVAESMFRAMSETSAEVPRDVDEFNITGIAKAPCRAIACPCVAGAPAVLECVLVEEITLRGSGNAMIIGEVRGVQMRDDCITDGRFDVTRYNPVARLGHQDYTVVREVIALARPDER